MLTGSLPFGAEEVLSSYSKGNVTIPFPEEAWSTISPEAILLTKQLLCTNPFVRLSASGALFSPWITDNGAWDPLSNINSSESEHQKDRQKEQISTDLKQLGYSDSSREHELHEKAISRHARARWRTAICSVRVLIRIGGIDGNMQAHEFGERCSLASLSSSSYPESEWDYSIGDPDDLALSQGFSFDSSDPSVSSGRLPPAPRTPRDIEILLEGLPENEMTSEHEKVLERVRSRQKKRNTRLSTFARMSEGPDANCGGRGFQKNYADSAGSQGHCQSPVAVSDLHGNVEARSFSEGAAQVGSAGQKSLPQASSEELKSQLQASVDTNLGSDDGSFQSIPQRTDGALIGIFRARTGKGLFQNIRTAFRSKNT